MRLIDADALYKKILAYVCVPCTFSEESKEIEKDCKDCVVRRVMNIVDNFPTIVQQEVKKISYADCADAMLMMWMDKVLTDGEYDRIMDKLNAHEMEQNDE